MMQTEDAFGLIIIFMVGCSLYFNPRINVDRIAMQWGMDGQPARFVPKWFGVWGLVWVVLCAGALLWIAKNVLHASIQSAETGLLAALIVLAIAHFYVLRQAAQSQ